MRGLALGVATALLVAASSAPKKAACGEPDDKGRVPRMTEVMSCQEAARAAFAEKRRKRTGKPPSPEDQDAFDDFQRAQMRAYMEKHPREATIDGEREAQRQQEAAAGPTGVIDQVRAAVGAAKDKLIGGKPKPASPPKAPRAEESSAEAEARDVIGTLKDGERMGEIDLEALAEKARSDPNGTLRRAVRDRNRQFEENVPGEAKKFFSKPGAKSAPPPDDLE